MKLLLPIVLAAALCKNFEYFAVAYFFQSLPSTTSSSKIHIGSPKYFEFIPPNQSFYPVTGLLYNSRSIRTVKQLFQKANYSVIRSMVDRFATSDEIEIPRDKEKGITLLLKAFPSTGVFAVSTSNVLWFSVTLPLDGKLFELQQLRGTKEDEDENPKIFSYRFHPNATTLLIAVGIPQKAPVEQNQSAILEKIRNVVSRFDFMKALDSNSFLLNTGLQQKTLVLSEIAFEVARLFEVQSRCVFVGAAVSYSQIAGYSPTWIWLFAFLVISLFVLLSWGVSSYI